MCFCEESWPTRFKGHRKKERFHDLEGREMKSSVQEKEKWFLGVSLSRLEQGEDLQLGYGHGSISGKPNIEGGIRWVRLLPGRARPE